MSDELEVQAKAEMEALRVAICKTPADFEVWNWAEDVCLRFVVDEANEEREEAGHSIRGFIAADMAYRLGVQLQEMTKNVHPDESKKANAEARAAKRLAAKLEVIAEAEGVPVGE